MRWVDRRACERNRRRCQWPRVYGAACWLVRTFGGLPLVLEAGAQVTVAEQAAEFELENGSERLLPENRSSRIHLLSSGHLHDPMDASLERAAAGEEDHEQQ